MKYLVAKSLRGYPFGVYQREGWEAYLLEIIWEGDDYLEGVLVAKKANAQEKKEEVESQ